MEGKCHDGVGPLGGGRETDGGGGWTPQKLWEPQEATGGEAETERGHRGRRIFYQQNSRTDSGWSLETSSSAA